jgi:hypothetical protein
VLACWYRTRNPSWKTASTATAVERSLVTRSHRTLLMLLADITKRCLIVFRLLNLHNILFNKSTIQLKNCVPYLIVQYISLFLWFYKLCFIFISVMVPHGKSIFSDVKVGPRPCIEGWGLSSCSHHVLDRALVSLRPSDENSIAQRSTDLLL